MTRRGGEGGTERGGGKEGKDLLCLGTGEKWKAWKYWGAALGLSQQYKGKRLHGDQKEAKKYEEIKKSQR